MSEVSRTIEACTRIPGEVSDLSHDERKLLPSASSPLMAALGVAESCVNYSDKLLKRVTGLDTREQLDQAEAAVEALTKEDDETTNEMGLRYMEQIDACINLQIAEHGTSQLSHRIIGDPTFTITRIARALTEWETSSDQQVIVNGCVSALTTESRKLRSAFHEARAMGRDLDEPNMVRTLILSWSADLDSRLTAVHNGDSGNQGDGKAQRQRFRRGKKGRGRQGKRGRSREHASYADAARNGAKDETAIQKEGNCYYCGRSCPSLIRCARKNFLSVRSSPFRTDCLEGGRVVS